MDSRTLAFLCLLAVFAGCITDTIQAINFCRVDGFYRQYDIEKKICCGGRLKNRENAFLRCCHDTGHVYDASRQVCCGEVHAIPANRSPEDYGCCRHGRGQPTLFNTDEQQCCMGRLHNIRTYYGEDFDVIDGFCCGTKFIKTDLNNPYQDCCINAASPHNSQVYSSDRQICCAERVLPIIDNKRDCCGPDPYDATKSLCCANSSGEKTLHLDQGYGRMACCANAPGGIIDRTAEVCIDGEPYETECVGHDRSSHACCAGRFRYDPDTQRCCGIEVIPKEKECCVSQVVEEGQVCCGPYHGVVNKTDPRQNSCCAGTTFYETYDSERAKCHDGRVVPINMCNNQVYNPEEKVCCDGYLHRKMFGYACCGRRLYNPNYLTCCNGRRVRGSHRTCPQ